MIDSTAIVSPLATIGDQVRIDPYAVVEAHTVIGDRTWLGSHSVIRSYTELGCDNRIHEFAVLGGEPQSTGFHGGRTHLKIGDRNSIREMVTINRGTESGGVTRIGNDNIFMAYSHIAHDCQVDNHCVFANGTNIAGHVVIGDYAFLGGFTLIHQNCRIGAHCITGINTILRQDAPPYMMINGHPARVVSVNTVGLKRRAFDPATIIALKKIYKLYCLKNLKTDQILLHLDDETKQNDAVQSFFAFMNDSERGVLR